MDKIIRLSGIQLTSLFTYDTLHKNVNLHVISIIEHKVD